MSIMLILIILVLSVIALGGIAMAAVTVLLPIVCIVSGLMGIIGLFPDSSNAIEDSSAEESSAEIVSAEMSSDAVIYDNNDKVYHPSMDSLAFDSENAALYYENLLDVYLWSEISEEEKRELAGIVDGEVVGDINGSINMLQIQTDADGFSELTEMAELLMQSDLVLYASCAFPVDFSENNALYESEYSPSMADENPWRDEDDRGNEEEPAGNDWWAEAIGAYTAWQYADEIAEPVKIGIMDSGFYPSHEDLLGKISVLDDYPYKLKDSHGTMVAGIAAASDNETGIRGVADRSGLTCVSYRGFLDGDGAYEAVSADFAEATKQMLDDGAKVINNSWGVCVYDKDTFARLSEDADASEGWDLGRYLKKFFPGNTASTKEAYDSYYEWTTVSCPRATSAICINMIIQLLIAGKDDFMFVSSAGNGWNNSGSKGYDVCWEKYYTAVTRDNFERCLGKDKIELLENGMGITFDDIRDHVMVVAATGHPDSSGNYWLTPYSNFGSNVDMAAPGGESGSKEQGILSCAFDVIRPDDDDYPARESLWESHFENQEDAYRSVYDFSCGTSMSAPMVTGAAAFVWSINPQLSASEVKGLLIDMADVATGITDEDAGRQYPMLNVGAAVKKAVEDRDGSAKEETKPQEEDKPEETEPEKTAVSEPAIVFSANIGEYGGRFYMTPATFGSINWPDVLEKDGIRIEALPFDSPNPDMDIYHFAFYRDNVYLSCKSGGTSDVRTELYVCDVDGGNAHKLADDCWGFYLIGDELHCMDEEFIYRMNDLGDTKEDSNKAGYYDLSDECWKETDEAAPNPWLEAGKKGFFTATALYELKEDGIYRTPYEVKRDGGEAFGAPELVLDLETYRRTYEHNDGGWRVTGGELGTYTTLSFATDRYLFLESTGYLYKVDPYSLQGLLFCYDIETGTLHLMGQKDEAGGGTPYFIF